MFEIFVKKPRKFITVTGTGYFFSLKPSQEQDEDNDIHYSPIGSAVFELLLLLYIRGFAHII